MEAHEIRTVMRTRAHFRTEGREGSFWMPEKFNDGSMWIGTFTGQSPWERHPDTDELIHVLEGEVQVTVLTDDDSTTTTMRAGSLCVVPRGCWHRLLAREGVTACGVTPGSTDHSEAEDPRQRN